MVENFDMRNPLTWGMEKGDWRSLNLYKNYFVILTQCTEYRSYKYLGFRNPSCVGERETKIIVSSFDFIDFSQEKKI